MDTGSTQALLKDHSSFSRVNSDFSRRSSVTSTSSQLPDVVNPTRENQPLLLTPVSEMEASDQYYPLQRNDSILDDPEYAAIAKEAERAIEGGVLPIRIAAGSSGSYFVRNLEGKTIAVFKPKDEEPYGRFNPKWSKWLQKNLCPCCFGRGCLVPNQGYLSEAGASIIDRKLRLNIVPKTRVVRIAADSFNYPSYQRRLVLAKREINESIGRHMHGRRVFQPKGLPPKIGSFQLFMNNYIDADVFLKKIEHKPLSEEQKAQFQFQFEKMVVLDYIIRNTDRNNGNWLVKYDEKADNEPEKPNEQLLDGFVGIEEADGQARATTTSPAADSILIAAIDNGLAFPFKHPDEWRAYPFHWAWLPQAKVPFSDEIKALILPLISDMNFVQQELCEEIQRLFSRDKNFDREMVEGQVAVMRGQLLNLAQAMRDGRSPFKLVQMPAVLVERVSLGASYGPRQFQQKFNDRYPIFTSF